MGRVPSGIQVEHPIPLIFQIPPESAIRGRYYGSSTGSHCERKETDRVAKNARNKGFRMREMWDTLTAFANEKVCCALSPMPLDMVLFSTRILTRLILPPSKRLAS